MFMKLHGSNHLLYGVPWVSCSMDIEMEYFCEVRTIFGMEFNFPNENEMSGFFEVQIISQFLAFQRTSLR